MICLDRCQTLHAPPAMVDKRRWYLKGKQAGLSAPTAAIAQFVIQLRTALSRISCGVRYSKSTGCQLCHVPHPWSVGDLVIYTTILLHHIFVPFLCNVYIVMPVSIQKIHVKRFIFRSIHIEIQYLRRTGRSLFNKPVHHPRSGHGGRQLFMIIK